MKRDRRKWAQPRVSRERIVRKARRTALSTSMQYISEVLHGVVLTNVHNGRKRKLVAITIVWYWFINIFKFISL